MKRKLPLMTKLHYLNDEIYSKFRVAIHPPTRYKQNLIRGVVQGQMRRASIMIEGFGNDK